MCGVDEASEGCAGCSGAGHEPEAMKRMVDALDVNGLLSEAERAEAAVRCAACVDTEFCADWLGVAEIRGADHAPAFCLNAETFDRLASEAPTTA